MSRRVDDSKHGVEMTQPHQRAGIALTDRYGYNTDNDPAAAEKMPFIKSASSTPSLPLFPITPKDEVSVQPKSILKKSILKKPSAEESSLTENIHKPQMGGIAAGIVFRFTHCMSTIDAFNVMYSFIL